MVEAAHAVFPPILFHNAQSRHAVVRAYHMSAIGMPMFELDFGTRFRYFIGALGRLDRIDGPSERITGLLLIQGSSSKPASQLRPQKFWVEL